jgi:hypothetical protein
MVIVKISDIDRAVGAWLSTNPAEAEPTAYPKLMYNVNLPPVIVHDAEQENNMGEAWRTLYVGPLPDVPTVSLDPTSDTVAASLETAKFHVTITGPGASGTWTAEMDPADDWLSIVAPTTPQSADGDVTYAVTANIGPLRTAEITVHGKVFTVTQSAGE